MDDYTDDYVPSFLNEEPIVLAGLTDSELAVCGALGAISGVIGTIISVSFLSLGALHVLVFIACVLLAAFICAKWLSSMKTGKPRGYVSARIKVKGAKYLPLLFNGSGMYLHDTKLSVGRSKRPLLEWVIDNEE